VVWVLASGGTGALLVSPFNVEWECYAWAGGVEESMFCFFSVVFPVRCISSISTRFYFRKNTFCFLPLVIIFKTQLLLECDILVGGDSGYSSLYLVGQAQYMSWNMYMINIQRRNK
jgi:hypothetical protein